MDKSGLIVFAVGKNLNEFIVQDVILDSPAYEAGIKPGDVIRKLQGFPVKIFSLDGISRILQKKEGKTIRLTILRKNEFIKIRFNLRDLI
jgi:carboxyl-terminal processing protease